MCTGAILLFQIPRVVVGEADTFAGDLDFLIGQGVSVTLRDDERCRAVMREFQGNRHPAVWSEDIGGRERGPSTRAVSAISGRIQTQIADPLQ